MARYRRLQEIAAVRVAPDVAVGELAATPLVRAARRPLVPEGWASPEMLQPGWAAHPDLAAPQWPEAGLLRAVPLAQRRPLAKVANPARMVWQMAPPGSVGWRSGPPSSSGPKKVVRDQPWVGLRTGSVHEAA